MPLGSVPPPPRPAWALAETDEDGPIVVLGAAERMETEAPAEEPGTEQRARRREVDAAEGAAKRLRVMRNSARRAEAVANAADAAVGDGEFTQGQQLNAIHVRQEDRRRETARKRARGSAGEAELPGSDGQANAAAVALVRRALGAASGAAREWNGRWVRRWVQEVTGARATLAAEIAVRPPTAQERSEERALQEREEVARRARGLRRQEVERAREEAARATAGESYGVPLGGVPPPPRPAWALAETDEDGPIVVLGAAERMETTAPAEEPGTEQRTRRREVDAAEGAARKLRVMRNSARRAEAIANAADAAVGDGEFTQGQQLNAIHVRQADWRRETARKRARGSAGETLGEELCALAGAQGGEHADVRVGKWVRTSGGPASAP